MFNDISYAVRFYVAGELSDEVYHNTEEDALEHFAMFDESDGYSQIELVAVDCVKRSETLIDANAF